MKNYILGKSLLSIDSKNLGHCTPRYFDTWSLTAQHGEHKMHVFEKGHSLDIAWNFFEFLLMSSIDHHLLNKHRDCLLENPNW